MINVTGMAEKRDNRCRGRTGREEIYKGYPGAIVCQWRYRPYPAMRQFDSPRRGNNGIPLLNWIAFPAAIPSAYRDLVSVLNSGNSGAGTSGNSGRKTIPLPCQHKRRECLFASPVNSLHAQENHYTFEHPEPGAVDSTDRLSVRLHPPITGHPGSSSGNALHMSSFS